MTGYKSKRDAALDEEGMYLVHHTKRKVDDDDDIQVYKRTWVGLTKDEKETLSYKAEGNTWTAVELAEAKLKEKNT